MSSDEKKASIFESKPFRWVPEEYIYDTGSECIEAHPEQAAVGLINTEHYLALQEKLRIAKLALWKAHGALGYAYDDQADKFYSNSQDSIQEALKKIEGAE